MIEGARAESEEVVDLRNRLRDVGDQGRRGTCVAFAITAIHEADRTSVEDEPEHLSEETLHWGSKQIDGDEGDGTRFSSADRAIRRWGQPAEALWPYDEGRDHTHTNYRPPPEAIDPDNCHFSALRSVPLDLDLIRSELEASRPVAIGIQVWDGFRRAELEPLPAPKRTELLPTGHAVVVVGYDPTAGSLLIRNSWGEGWGNKGHLWVSERLLAVALAAWVIDPIATFESVAREEVLSQEGQEHEPE